MHVRMAAVLVVGCLAASCAGPRPLNAPLVVAQAPNASAASGDSQPTLAPREGLPLTTNAQAQWTERETAIVRRFDRSHRERPNVPANATHAELETWANDVLRPWSVGHMRMSQAACWPRDELPRESLVFFSRVCMLAVQDLQDITQALVDTSARGSTPAEAQRFRAELCPLRRTPFELAINCASHVRRARDAVASQWMALLERFDRERAITNAECPNATPLPEGDR